MSKPETTGNLNNGESALSIKPPIAPNFDNMGSTGEGRSDTNQLSEKRKELDKVLQEIQELEKTAHSPSSTKSPNARTKVSVPFQDDLYTRVLVLEKELKVKDDELLFLINEKKALEKIINKQREGTVQLTQELGSTKTLVLQLQYDLQLKTDENKTLFSEKKGSYDHNVENQTQVRQLEEENRKTGKGAYPRDLYYEMMKFENEVVDRDRVIIELKQENKTLENLLKQREEDYDGLQKAVEIGREEAAHHTIVILENKVTELTNIIGELQTENRTLITIQNSKTEAIEELTKELTVRGATDEYVNLLKKEIQVKDKEIGDWIQENRMLQRDLEQREQLIARLKQEELGVPFNLWQEERKLLKAELKKLQEIRASNEKTIAKQRDRLRQLNERVEFVSKTLSSAGSPIKVPRGGQTVNSSSTRKKAVLTPSPKSKAALNSAASPGTPLDLNTSIGSLELNTAPTTEEDVVPSSMFDALKVTLEKLTSNLQAKDKVLSEKDEIMEMLEKKFDVESKARSSEQKVFKKREAELKDQIEVLKNRLEFIDTEHREREQELRMELYNLRGK